MGLYAAHETLADAGSSAASQAKSEVDVGDATGRSDSHLMAAKRESRNHAPWVLVCGGFHRHGGMDRANFALAEKLIEQGRDVYLVANEIDSRLAGQPGVHPVIVPRPLGSILLSERNLRRAGFKTAAQVTRRWPDARVVVNGSNCDWADINWVHSVHAAWPRRDRTAPLWFRTKSAFSKTKAVREEARILPVAKLLIANSERTRHDLISVGVPSERIQVIRLGCEWDWQPASEHERLMARQAFDIAPELTVVSFVGALGYDCNKGFDTLLAAWGDLGWKDSVLVAAGAGRGFHQWQRAVAKQGLQNSVRLLGFTERVHTLLAASDLFVSPARYESFGLNVLEALCRGVPSIVSKSAGVAELYPARLSRWLLTSPEDYRELAGLLSDWHHNRSAATDSFRCFSSSLRSYSMERMAEKIIELAEANEDSMTSPNPVAIGPRGSVG